MIAHLVKQTAKAKGFTVGANGSLEGGTLESGVRWLPWKRDPNRVIAEQRPNRESPICESHSAALRFIRNSDSELQTFGLSSFGLSSFGAIRAGCMHRLGRFIAQMHKVSEQMLTIKNSFKMVIFQFVTQNVIHKSGFTIS